MSGPQGFYAGGGYFRTLDDDIFVNGQKVTEVYVNGELVYPVADDMADDGRFVYAVVTAAGSVSSEHTHDYHPDGYIGLPSAFAENIAYNVSWVCSARYSMSASVKALLRFESKYAPMARVSNKTITHTYSGATTDHGAAANSADGGSNGKRINLASACMGEQSFAVTPLEGVNGGTILKCSKSVTAQIPTCGPYTLSHWWSFNTVRHVNDASTSASPPALNPNDVTVSTVVGDSGLVGFALRANVDVEHTFVSTPPEDDGSGATAKSFLCKQNLFLGRIPLASVLYLGRELADAEAAMG